MVRAFLLVYPFLIVYVTVGALLFVPLTWIIRDIRPIYWVGRLAVRVAFWLSGVRIKVVHPEYACQHPTCVFVSNHISNVDPPALFLILPRIVVILKRELRKLPLLGYAMGMAGFIYVNRQDPESRRKAFEAAVATLHGGVSLLIFPEGTRSKDGKLLPFRSGGFRMAIEAAVPVVPITVHGAGERMPKGKPSIAPGNICLVFHPPIATKGLTPNDRIDLMQRVRDTMEKQLLGQNFRAATESVAKAR